MTTFPQSRLPSSTDKNTQLLRQIAQRPASQASPPPAPEERRSDALYYAKVVLKRKWLIFSIAVVCTTLATIHAFRRPALYEATTTVRIEQTSSDSLPNGQFVYASHSPEYWNTQIQSLQSPRLMRQVALFLDLQHNPSFLSAPEAEGGFYASVSRLSARLTSKPAAQTAPASNVLPDGFSSGLDPDNLSVEQRTQIEPYVGRLLGGLTVQPVPSTNLISVSFRHTDPTLALKVADAVANIFTKNEMQRETAGSQNAADRLARDVADLQMSISHQEEQRINYMKNNDLPLGPAKGQNLTLERLGTLSGQLLTAENERKNLQSAYEEAQKASDVWSIPEVNENKEIQDGRLLIRTLAQRRAELMTAYTAEWPEVKKIEAQIEQLQSDIDKTARQTVSVLKSRYDASLAREAKLRQAYLEEREANNRQSLSEITLSSVNQQIETSKQLYNLMYQRLKELEITSSNRATEITIHSPASMPTEALPQGRATKILIALLASLAAGIGLALLLDFLDNTLKSMADVAKHTQLPTLALIPAVRRKRRLLRDKEANSTHRSKSAALALIDDMRSPFAEAYRHLRTSLLFASAGRPPQTILVTSGGVAEGKTTTAINTAITFAHTGKDVVIIDCDLRRPCVHSYFKLPNTSGLTNYLSGQLDDDALLYVHNSLPNLKVVTAGPTPSNPADFLGSGEMRELLRVLKEQFAYVIIDSPPATSFSDAAILSQLADGVILVVNSEKSSRRMVQRVRHRLSEVGAHIYGVVLNFSGTEADEYYSGYYSSYYATETAGASVETLARKAS